MSLNLQRRSLSIAQRGLIVSQLYLPQAEAEAKERFGARTDLSGTLAPIGAKVPPTSPRSQRASKAVYIAAERSNGLASARTLERMAPVWEAPTKASGRPSPHSVPAMGSDKPIRWNAAKYGQDRRPGTLC